MMKKIHYNSYAAFAASLVCGAWSPAALAQTPDDDPMPAPRILVATPPSEDYQPEQAPLLAPANPQLTPAEPLRPGNIIGIERDPNIYLPQTAYQTEGLVPLNQRNLFSRHMMDRTRQILVLRRLLALRFSADDMAVALPLLRRLNDIKAAPPIDPERALESEYEALLLARPGDPLPPSSAIKITDAAHYYREEEAKIWGEMARRLGRSKADGLYNLLGQQPDPAIGSIRASRAAKQQPGRGPGSPNYFDDPVPRQEAPKDARSSYSRRGRSGPEMPRDSDSESPLILAPLPATPRTAPDEEQDPTLPETARPAEATPSVSRTETPRRNRLPSVTPANPLEATDPRPAAMTPVQRPRDTADGRVASSSEYPLMVYSTTTVRISLSELIDLMQTKLNAMARNDSGTPASR